MAFLEELPKREPLPAIPTSRLAGLTLIEKLTEPFATVGSFSYTPRNSCQGAATAHRVAAPQEVETQLDLPSLFIEEQYSRPRSSLGMATLEERFMDWAKATPTAPPSWPVTGGVSSIPFSTLKLDRHIKSSFYPVYKCLLNQQPVAVKVLLDKDGGQVLEQEVWAMVVDKLRPDVERITATDHPNILQLVALCEGPPCLVTPWCQRGSLHTIILAAQATPEKLSWERRLDLALGIARGMRHMHVGDRFVWLHGRCDALPAGAPGVLFGGSMGGRVCVRAPLPARRHPPCLAALPPPNVAVLRCPLTEGHTSPLTPTRAA